MHRISTTLTLLLLTLLPTASRAGAAADTAPADALAFLSFKGAHHLGPAYESSHLKAVLDASTFPQFYRDLLPQLLQKATAANPDDARRLTDALAALEIAARHGFSLYLRPVPDRAGAPVTFTLTCDARDQADSLENRLKPLIDNHPKISLTRSGTRLSLHLGPATAADADAPTLSTSPAYQSALQHVDPDPVLQLYLDAERILSLLN